jgi:predicted small lipoprotein YifL
VPDSVGIGMRFQDRGADGDEMIAGMPRATIAPLALAVALAAALGGCGVRGSLENPAKAETKSTAGAESGQGKAEGEAPKPHRSFVLDGLIR